MQFWTVFRGLFKALKEVHFLYEAPLPRFIQNVFSINTEITKNCFQFLNGKEQYHTERYQNSNDKLFKQAKSIPVTHVYMAVSLSSVGTYIIYIYIVHVIYGFIVLCSNEFLIQESPFFLYFSYLYGC